jgi:cyclin-dependent kinase
VAVKRFLRVDADQRADWKEMIHNEISILKELQGNPNIVELVGYVHAANDESHVTHIIFELYITDLSKRISMQASAQSKQPFPFELVQRQMKQLLQAMAKIHSNGIIHRDMKPPNLLLNKNDDLFLADFGLSEHLEGIAK